MNAVRQETSGIEYDAWLASACLPSVRLRKLIDQYGSAKTCYEAFYGKDPFIAEHIPDRFRRILEKNSREDRLEYYRKKTEKHGIRVMHIDEEDYPEQLECLDDPPALLFFQGNPECLKHRILAMVGSRAASYTGQKAAVKLAKDLSRNQISIISGLACGIDASAHQGCIEGGSPTIAVTGCGLDRVYPADNMKLRDRILEEGGLILSEYAPGEPPSGWHFPVRNRIITGLAGAVILMEAKIRSGSMTSVQHALEQGKDIFVYPGEPESEHYSGNHQLLREGGIYFTSAEDILEDMHWLDNPPAVRQNSGCSAESRATTPEELSVIQALNPGALSFEQLSGRTGLDPARLMSTLTILQIKGIVEAMPGKYYQIKH